MMHYKVISVMAIVSLLIIPTHANTKMTQLDVITPSGLIVHDSLNRISTNVKYPGLFLDTSEFKAVTGFIDDEENSSDYLGHPLTQYDSQQNFFTNMTPYLSAQKSFPGFCSGIYLGNFSANSKIHNALSTTDSIKTFDKSGIKLNGAIWFVPKIEFFKGISLWVEGVHQNRDAHFANIDGWKRIHTNFEYKRKYGYGLLSSTFSFFNNQYSFLRFGYGKDNVKSEEQRLDTLFFSNDSYLDSDENFDKSFEKYNSNAEIGHMLKFGGYNFGVFIGGDRTNFDYEKSEKDSSRFYVNSFIYKGFNLKKVLLYTGLNFTYSGSLFNESNHRLGYIDLAKEYTVDRMSHYIDLNAPIYGVITIGDKFTLMSGIDFAYDYKKSNYDFSTGTKNMSGFSSIDFILYPLIFQYAPKPNTSISISPKFDDEIFIGSLEIRYGF